MHCSIVVPALHRCVTTPHTNATLWFQRCSGGFQRPALMQHRGSSAALVDPDPTFGFWRHAGGLQRLLLMQGFRFLCIFMLFLGSMPPWRIPTTHFYAASWLQCRTAGLQRFMLTQHRVNNDRAPETQANKCCVAAWQPFTKTRSDGCLR